MSLEPLDVAGFKPPPPRERGAVSQLQWVALADLRIDRSYQRDLTAESRKRIHAIAAEFDWSCFTPVIVAAIEGGRFAVIDGQHRSLAALLIGVELVPAMVVVADRARQAKSFAAINGNRTRMSAAAIYRAALAAGDETAVAVDRLARECGARVLTYQLSSDKLKPNECASPAEVVRLYAGFGAEVLRAAFLAVLASRGDTRGLLNATCLRALAMLFRDKPLAPATIKQAFAHIDLRDALAAVRREGLGSVYSDLRDEIARRLLKLAKRAA